MPPFISGEINFRLVYQALAGVLILVWALNRAGIPWISRKVAAFTALLERRPQHSVAIAASVFFVIGLASKLSQLSALLYSGQDFWLLQDMFHWMAKGSPYVTRFCNQAYGPVQHGGNHAFLSAYVLVPFVWVFGATTVAVMLNPLGLALGSWLAGRLAFEWTRSGLVAICVSVGFCALEWTSRTLMYETHPEAWYPFLVFLVTSVSLKAGSKNTIAAALGLLIAWFALSGLKQDGVCIALLVWFWLTVYRSWSWKASCASLATILITGATMTLLIAKFKSGAIGDTSISLGGFQIPISLAPIGSDILGGVPITGFKSIAAILEQFVSKAGGVQALFVQIFGYPLKNPFLTFALVAPWVWLRLESWILIVPMALLYGLMGNRAGHLVNYYAIPLVALMFLAILLDFRKSEAVKSRIPRQFKLSWLVLFALLHGGSGPKIFIPSEYASEVKQDTAKAIGQTLSPAAGLGIVSSHLLAQVPLDRVFSDHVPIKAEEIFPDTVNWVLFPTNADSFEMSAQAAKTWGETAVASGAWVASEFGTLTLYRRSR